CHGPDAATRKIPLRLDSEAGMTALINGHRAVTAGDVNASELVKRIAADKPALRMPPAYSGLKLSAKELDLLKQWISGGSRWQKHWSLIPPRKPDTPEVGNKSWIVNPVDAFVLARLEKEGLQPSPEAGREALIRRVSLDVTGIPPTPAEV